MSESMPAEKRSGFPTVFWLVILFEFFERGSYYGMMSVLSVYLTDILNISKENVGLIKGTIQPILYFLPIISGALADRFGYRKVLIIAFTLLGGGYMLTSRMTSYTAVFLALCVMALGAGAFKPVISGSIARVTDKSNSTLGFGIYYWSINLGAFLFPLFLVPWLKTVPSQPPWQWVIIAAAIGTGVMIIPTLLFYKEPPKPGDKRKDRERAIKLTQTLADAFEIIYSPFILLFRAAGKSGVMKTVIYGTAGLLGLYMVYRFAWGGPFLLFFVMFLFWGSQLIMALQPASFCKSSASRMIISLVLVGVLWLIPGLSLYARLVSSVITFTLNALFLIDRSDQQKFRDHFRFLLLIFIYSGFWVLYFQMFDSVLWYVRDYVDAAGLDSSVNALLGRLGISYQWHFDIEHVTVINAGTIILLQLLVSTIVRKRKALPTMMAGILMGTLGMAILAVNTNIWVFMAGIVIFSVGEMTAHPKFISYVGQTAPRDRVATYMGYIFLYGVIGASIGAPLGANLYVHFVDNLNQPRTLWLIFSGIGVLTLAAIALYNRFLTPHSEKAEGI